MATVYSLSFPLSSKYKTKTDLEILKTRPALETVETVVTVGEARAVTESKELKVDIETTTGAAQLVEPALHVATECVRVTETTSGADVTVEGGPPTMEITRHRTMETREIELVPVAVETQETITQTKTTVTRTLEGVSETGEPVESREISKMVKIDQEVTVEPITVGERPLLGGGVTETKTTVIKQLGEVQEGQELPVENTVTTVTESKTTVSQDTTGVKPFETPVSPLESTVTTETKVSKEGTVSETTVPEKVPEEVKPLETVPEAAKPVEVGETKTTVPQEPEKVSEPSKPEEAPETKQAVPQEVPVTPAPETKPTVSEEAIPVEVPEPTVPQEPTVETTVSQAPETKTTVSEEPKASEVVETKPTVSEEKADRVETHVSAGEAATETAVAEPTIEISKVEESRPVPTITVTEPKIDEVWGTKDREKAKLPF